MPRRAPLPSVEDMKALITGASRGLGLALARSLIEDGWEVIADARDGTALAAALPEAVTIPGDITMAGHRAVLAAAAGDRLDLLVNNAGTLGAAPLPAVADYPLDELRSAFEANVLAPLALTQALLPALRASEAGGAVLNVTSDAAVEPYPGWGGYGATKAALEQASAVLAAERPDLLVWRVDPGDLRTDMHQAAFPGEDISDRPLPSTVAPVLLGLISKRPPSGRYTIGELS
jgi:NAD(P)-dependent dehydrogenase (short-subunit alcohol dehydrogenase family)